jgi:hypothetical protein
VDLLDQTVFLVNLVLQDQMVLVANLALVGLMVLQGLQVNRVLTVVQV